MVLAVTRYILLSMIIAGVLSGCEREKVYIPPQYSTPSSYSAPQTAATSIQQVRPTTQAPVVRIEEANPLTRPDPVLQQVGAQSTLAVEETQPKKLKKEEASKSPQRQASMQQVNQARGQLERGKTDAAIRTLEKAVRIDAGNGEAFILLARAWRQKGEKRKALEFAKKAELLCQKQPVKLKEVYLLESDLYRELEESMKDGHKLRQKPGEPQKIQ
jgi:Flp pilus assembly protein TadD